MIVLEHKGLEIDYCLSCGGAWLDTGELDLLLGADLGTPPSTWLDSGKLGTRNCPHCTRTLRAAHFPGSTVELDVCPGDHGVWLDAGELKQLAARPKGGIEAEALSGYIFDVLAHAQQRITKEG